MESHRDQLMSRHPVIVVTTSALFVIVETPVCDQKSTVKTKFHAGGKIRACEQVGPEHTKSFLDFPGSRAGDHQPHRIGTAGIF